MAQVPHRPTHTGSARQQALREADRQQRAQQRGATHSTHLRLPGAAVAVGPDPDGPRPRVCQARRALSLGHGQQAVAVRQWPDDREVEALICGPGQAKRWRPIGEVMGPARGRLWARTGFGAR